MQMHMQMGIHMPEEYNSCKSVCFLLIKVLSLYYIIMNLFLFYLVVFCCFCNIICVTFHITFVIIDIYIYIHYIYYIMKENC